MNDEFSKNAENIEKLTQFSRSEMLLGKDSTEKLFNCHVAIFGLGGVGSFATEALARAGVGKFTLVDKDIYELTNLNRQLYATFDTIGKDKVEVAKTRILSINPKATIIARKCFFLPENANQFDFDEFDYVVDCIDNVTGKLALIESVKKSKNNNIICSMGTGNKLDPTRLKIDDIYNTKICPLAKVMRTECKKRNIDSLKVLYSDEEPLVKQTPPGSVPFVPSVAGLIIASVVIKNLLKVNHERT